MPNTGLEALLQKYRKLHFIGIGGISMSALAEILKNRGYQVTGSDINDSEQINKLRKIGIRVFIGHSRENIGDAQIVINTAAIKETNVELCAAREAGIPCFERSVLLGCIMKNYAYPIAIAGTHGKTTTTSFASQIFIEAGCDPTCLVGGQLNAIGGNFRVGKSNYLICEACEYVDSFLTLHPQIAVVLNVEEDHLDYFSGIEQIKQSFHTFVSLAGPSGICIINADSQNAMDACGNVLETTITFGIENPNAAVSARNIQADENGYPVFDLFENNVFLFRVTLKVPGRHNVYNALAAAAIAISLHIDTKHIHRALSSFTGTKRRFEHIGTYNGATIVDDYAHHPTEIAATLATAKSLNYQRVICIFQPHTYTRTLALFDAFVGSLEGCDVPILADIYAAREQNTSGISSADIAEKLDAAKYFSSFEAIVDYIQKEARPGDLILTMGAGDIYKVGLMICGQ